MIEERPQSTMFGELADELLEAGLAFRFQARGRSMLPFIQDGEIVHVKPIDPQDVRVADIVLFRDDAGFKAHRVVRRRKNQFVTRGDTGLEPDTAIQGEQIVGKVTAKECTANGRLVALDGAESILSYAAWATRWFLSGKVRGWLSRVKSPHVVGFSFIVALLILGVAANAQQTIGGVALDNTNSASFEAAGNGSTCPAGTGAGNWDCSFTHTTGSTIGSNSLLLVFTSMNNQGNGLDSRFTQVTYSGKLMSSSVIDNNNGALRIQAFYLKDPIQYCTGSCTIKATVHKTASGNNSIGVVIAAMTLYQVSQNFGTTYPIIVSALGTGTTASVSFSAANLPANNDGVIDVIAVGPNITVTPNATVAAPLFFQNQQWTKQSGATGQDVTGAGSSTGGVGAALTIQETLSASAAWMIAAIAVPASQPTAVKSDNFSATQTPNGVLLSWHTSGEMHNLGFNVYRDVDGQKIRVNPSLIAGSALLMRDTGEQHGARTYGWIDQSPGTSALYWLEDADVNGTRTLHGPVQVEQQLAGVPQFSAFSRSRDIPATIADLSRSSSASSASAHVRETVAHPENTSTARAVGFQLASQRAIKIFVDHEGWYRITQPQLVAAGLSPEIQASSLHLFAEGVEQPIRVMGADSRFGANSAIEFYGTAIDTPYSGQRVYWLVTKDGRGQRIQTESATGTSGPAAQNFMQTLELKPRTTYFAALLKENTDNFFGPLISPTAAIQTFNVSNPAMGEGRLVITLQGVTLGQQHDVTVTLNGAALGSVNFADQQEGRGAFQIPSGVLVTGTNTITLTAQQGDNDLSLVDHIEVSFPHSFTAESDLLKFTAASGQAITIDGFTQPPSRLLDITNPAQPIVLTFKTSVQSGAYTLSGTVPWNSFGTHTLLALSDAQLASAAMILHQPTNLHSPQTGAEAIVLAAPEFMDQVRPLAVLRQAEGRSVALININDIYDEFNFGERTPFAIRHFLRSANSTWKTAPHYLVLAGDASVDPRNYLGFGFLDFIPTKIVISSELKTASDDWFSDFENTGFAKIATGRLPARTPADMQTIVGKIVGYSQADGGTWTNQSMLVADIDDPTVSFSQAALSVQKMLPSTMNVTDVFAGALGPGTAQQVLLTGVNAGQLLVNYNGHGSVEVWGSGLFNDTMASSLTNGNKLPLFVAMNCLNGFFHDVYTQSLATALMLAPNGGAVSVWASSGLTEPAPQFQMDQSLVQSLFSQPSITVGDAVISAKSAIADSDVRKTFILFGDPMMRLKAGATVTLPVALPVTRQPENMPHPGRELE